MFTGGGVMILLVRRGKLSLPGGASAASYIGKFNQGEPVGKGRLVTLAKKKPFKGKFSSIPEIINRYLLPYLMYLLPYRRLYKRYLILFILFVIESCFQDVHYGM